MACPRTLLLDQGQRSVALLPSAPGVLNDFVDEAALPRPVIGDSLFVVDPGSRQCLDRQDVVAQFQSDAAAIGGRTIEISSTSAQAFADRWRDSVSIERTAVSTVIAHLYFDGRIDEWTADLVEIDETGCAMSRTLLPYFALNALFAAVEPSA